MQQLHLVGFTADNRGLIFSARKGAKSGGFVVTLDDKLLARVDEMVARREEEEGDQSSSRPRSILSPREIQARLRAGRTISQVAREAGVDDEWVARWAAPIAAEQAQVVERAQELTMEKGRVGRSAVSLGESVRWNMADKGIIFTAAGWTGSWDAFHLRTNSWMVRFTYQYRRATHQAEWEVDTRDATVVSRNRQATELGYVAPGTRRPKMPRSMLAAVDLPSVAPALRAASGAGSKGASTTGPTQPPSRPRAAKKKPTGSKQVAARTAAAKKKWAAIKKAADRKAAADRVAARKAVAKKAEAAKQEAAEKAAARQAAAEKKAAARRAAAKKAAAKKAAAEKAAAKKAAAKKAAEEKAADKKASVRKSGGTARSAAKPKRPAKRSVAKKSVVKKSAAKKATTRKSTAGKATTRKSVARKSVARKAPARKAAARPARSATVRPVVSRAGPATRPSAANGAARPSPASDRPLRRRIEPSARAEPRRFAAAAADGDGDGGSAAPPGSGRERREAEVAAPTRTPIRIDSGVPRRPDGGGPPIIRAPRADQSREEAGVGARSSDSGAPRQGRFRFRRGRSRT